MLRPGGSASARGSPASLNFPRTGPLTYLQDVFMRSPLYSAVTALLLLSLETLGAAERVVAIDQKKSRIEYRVGVPLGSFTGTLAAYESIITADPGRAQPVTRAEIRFRFTDLRSDNAKRDQAMRDWQNTEQFPECVYTLISLDPAGAPNSFNAKGQFIFHGQARELVFPVIISAANGVISIKGDAVIDTRAFGVPPLRRWGLLKVDPEVKVAIALFGSTPAQ